MAFLLRRIILSPVAYLALPYFSTLPHKLHEFRGKKITGHKIKRVFFRQIFEKSLIHVRLLKANWNWDILLSI